MKIRTLKLAIWLLIALALGCGLGLPRILLPGWSPLARAALGAGGQLLAYAGMAILAVWAEPLLRGRQNPPPRP